jgi:hypothetical protein
MSNENIIVGLTICGSLFIFDAIFLGIIFFTRRKVTQAANWPSTLGMVTSSRIEMRSSSEGGSTPYPVVNYSYPVMGQTYQGSKVMPGPDVGGIGARKVVERYPAGAQVMVYYNPDKPSEALLERSTPGFVKLFWIILIILDLFLCGLGAVLLFTL